MRKESPSSAGNTRGLIEAPDGQPGCAVRRPSSAGNTRGLIEADSLRAMPANWTRLPRGIPAASLKLLPRCCRAEKRGSLPRGIPAASLKVFRLPRGIPAASLKRVVVPFGGLAAIQVRAGEPGRLVNLPYLRRSMTATIKPPVPRMTPDSHMMIVCP